MREMGQKADWFTFWCYAIAFAFGSLALFLGGRALYHFLHWLTTVGL
jgi:hypothetical protein